MHDNLKKYLDKTSEIGYNMTMRESLSGLSVSKAERRLF